MSLPEKAPIESPAYGPFMFPIIAGNLIGLLQGLHGATEVGY
jgi:hypothetical protein